VVAQGVPVTVNVPLTEVPVCVRFPVPVPEAPNAVDVAVTVQWPVIFLDDDVPPPQPAVRQSTAMQSRRMDHISDLP